MTSAYGRRGPLTAASRMVAVPGLAAVVLVLGLVTAGPASASLPGADAALTRAPYLTDLTQTSVQVNWATNAQYTGVVEYGHREAARPIRSSPASWAHRSRLAR
jgi:hypothetical protein